MKAMVYKTPIDNQEELLNRITVAAEQIRNNPNELASSLLSFLFLVKYINVLFLDAVFLGEWRKLSLRNVSCSKTSIDSTLYVAKQFTYLYYNPFLNNGVLQQSQNIGN
jgi:hypothetical protein